MGERVTIPALGGEGSFGAYVSTPDGKPKGAVVVIQEVFGINAGIRAKVDAWAAEGYYAIALDLFWRLEPGIELDPDVPEQFERALALIRRFNVDAAVRDIEATIRFAREAAGGRKVGVVGFCLGGRMAYLSATRTDADAAVGYYGAGIDAVLGEAHAIANPLLLHFAGEDHFVPAETVTTIRTALAANPHVTIEEYPGVDHGFATSFGKRRVEEAAQLADGRTIAFFERHLAS
ncbi:dienelactone hydrolase family protein [Sphingomonas jatrophae]|uniref:Carboxymethylenebutenolidase n=1 Tax=Sphingomonas jatrophae TaxID=1166337 RepID=A0A1I6LNN3_9SPHN|nr:dienelactone hydrolase family protein [Sphingomonas jatrophae]SFS04998.1 carboxymethylenebutenolidase [Sphingomonas jatrophae]